MSRGRLIAIAVVVGIIVVLVLLSSLNTEVAPTRVEKAVPNDVLAK